MKKLSFVLSCILLSCTALAQDANPLDGYGIEANVLAGKILKHNYIFPPVPNASGGIDINILKNTDGSKDWQQRRNYPQIGLGLTYVNYGNNAIYGQCIGAYPVIPIKIISGRKFEWTAKVGIGIGYMTRRYERFPTWDTINNLIGSRMNNFTTAAMDVRYNFNKNLSLLLGFTFIHVSNGGLRLPNLGLNLPTGHIGIRYFPGNPMPKRKVNELPTLKNRWLVQARLGIGFSEIGANDGPMYPVYLTSLFVSKRYANGRNKAFAGLDHTYYRSLHAFLRNIEAYAGEENKYCQQASVIVGNEFLIGRFGIVMQVGFPFIKTVRENDGIYFPKFGYNYYLLKEERGIVKELTLHSYIKANRFEADVFEFGVGVGL